MIIGIEIIAKEFIGLLCRLFQKIDLSTYNWTSGHYDAYSSMTADGRDTRFSEPKISGEFVQKSISAPPEYSVFFLDLKGYSPEGQITEVETYSDFVQSDCQIIILINDFDNVEVYAKDLLILETIYQNALQSGSCKEVMYKTEENDCRTRMNVW